MKLSRFLMILLLLSMLVPVEGKAKCVGRFVNPITGLLQADK